MASRNLGFQHVHEPAAAPDPAYTMLLLHGTGADEHDLVPLGRSLAPGKPLLSPLGKVRENGMPRWFRRFAEGRFDEEDLRARAAELAAFLPQAASAYTLDPGRYVAMGFSNGANIAAGLLLLHPEALRGAVLLRAMVPLVPETLPDLTGVPVFIAAGRQDPMISPEGAQRLADLLTRAGADVTLQWVDAGHGLTPGELRDVRAWLAKHEATFATPRRA